MLLGSSSLLRETRVRSSGQEHRNQRPGVGCVQVFRDNYGVLQDRRLSLVYISMTVR